MNTNNKLTAAQKLELRQFTEHGELYTYRGNPTLKIWRALSEMGLITLVKTSDYGVTYAPVVK